MPDDILPQPPLATGGPDLASTGAVVSFLKELSLPLAAVEGFAELLRETALQPAQHQALLAVQENARRLVEQVADYRDLLQFGSGSWPVQPTVTELLPQLCELLAQCRQSAAAHGVDIDVVWTNFVPSQVLLDADTVRRAVLALLAHLLQRTVGGPLRIELAYRAWPSPSPLGRLRVQLSVTRFTLLDASAPFQPFPRSGQRGQPQLGPLLAQQLATAHGGMVRIVAGETLSCELEFAVERTAAAEWLDPLRHDEPRKAPVRLSGARILLAEDGRDSQLLLSAVLRSAGADLQLAERGDLALQQALAQARTGRPFDLLLLDLQLPVLDGREVLHVLRAHDYRGRIACISACRDEAVGRACLACGADVFLQKPVPPAQLLRTLAALLPAAAG